MTAQTLQNGPAKADYRMFETVVARVAVPGVSGRTIAAGTVGAIVEIFDTPRVAYMVEFPEDENLTLPVLEPEQIAPWVAPPAKKAA